MINIKKYNNKLFLELDVSLELFSKEKLTAKEQDKVNKLMFEKIKNEFKNLLTFDNWKDLVHESMPYISGNVKITYNECEESKNKFPKMMLVSNEK